MSKEKGITHIPYEDVPADHSDRPGFNLEWKFLQFLLKLGTYPYGKIENNKEVYVESFDWLSFGAEWDAFKSDDPQATRWSNKKCFKQFVDAPSDFFVRADKQDPATYNFFDVVGTRTLASGKVKLNTSHKDWEEKMDFIDEVHEENINCKQYLHLFMMESGDSCP